MDRILSWRLTKFTALSCGCLSSCIWFLVSDILLRSSSFWFNWLKLDFLGLRIAIDYELVVDHLLGPFLCSQFNCTESTELFKRYLYIMLWQSGRLHSGSLDLLLLGLVNSLLSFQECMGFLNGDLITIETTSVASSNIDLVPQFFLSASLLLLSFQEWVSSSKLKWRFDLAHFHTFWQSEFYDGMQGRSNIAYCDVFARKRLISKDLCKFVRWQSLCCWCGTYRPLPCSLWQRHGIGICFWPLDEDASTPCSLMTPKPHSVWRNMVYTVLLQLV